MNLSNKEIKTCSNCFYRKDSMRRCQEYIDKNKTGSISDPQPRFECKKHKLYGYSEDYEKTNCLDFTK